MEPETAALRTFLRAWPARVSSALSGVEVARAAARGATPVRPALVGRVIDGFALLPLDAAVLAVARTLAPVELRTLDALHLASALTLDADLGVFVAYDRRLLEAATAGGLPTRSPGA